jgi:hypothetical protein
MIAAIANRAALVEIAPDVPSSVVPVIAILISGLDRPFQPRIACFHSTFHTGRKHGRSCLSVRQRHSHGHQRASTVCIKSRFNMVVG